MSSRILAIDPGYDRCGLAIVDAGTTMEIVHSSCIITNKKDTHEDRLAQIFNTIELYIAEWHPTCIALETLFFSVNKKTALKVAEARGVIVLIAGLHHLPLLELSPQEVKQAMTGSGNANKEQVQKMVALTLKIDTKSRLDDEIDAIALGVAAAGKIKVEKWQ